MKDNNLEVNEKNLTLRIIAFAIVCLIAITAFTLGVSNIGKKEEGYYSVTESPDEDAVLYGGSYELIYHFTGDSNRIKEEMKLVSEAYSAALKRAYKLTDPSKEYNGYQNLATLNSHLNQDIIISDELYSILQDALERTDFEVYNMFSGALFSHWNSILTLTSPEEFDPVFNSEERVRLSNLAEMTARSDSFDLKLTCENSEYRAKLQVREEYIRFCEEQEESKQFLDLNLLRDAYVLRLVAKVLEKEGYTDGYLSADSGLLLALPDYQRGEYCLYGLDSGNVVQAKTFPVTAGSGCSIFRTFPMGEENGYYLVENGTDRIYRSPYVNLQPAGTNNLIMSSMMISQNGILEACYNNLRLLSMKAPEEIAEADFGEITNWAYTLIGGEELELRFGGNR